MKGTSTASNKGSKAWIQNFGADPSIFEILNFFVLLFHMVVPSLPPLLRVWILSKCNVDSNKGIKAWMQNFG